MRALRGEFQPRLRFVCSASEITLIVEQPGPYLTINSVRVHSKRDRGDKMKTDKPSNRFPRREFLNRGTNLAAAALVAPALLPRIGSTAEKPASAKMIGLQIGAVSFVDEGPDQALDILQSKGAV